MTLWHHSNRDLPDILSPVIENTSLPQAANQNLSLQLLHFTSIVTLQPKAAKLPSMPAVYWHELGKRCEAFDKKPQPRVDYSQQYGDHKPIYLKGMIFLTGDMQNRALHFSLHSPKQLQVQARRDFVVDFVLSFFMKLQPRCLLLSSKSMVVMFRSHRQDDSNILVLRRVLVEVLLSQDQSRNKAYCQASPPSVLLFKFCIATATSTMTLP